MDLQVESPIQSTTYNEEDATRKIHAQVKKNMKYHHVCVSYATLLPFRAVVQQATCMVIWVTGIG